MLVLSRKLTESICIHDKLVVKVLSVRGGRVRIGIDAPSDVMIRRSEVPVLPDAPNCNVLALDVEPPEHLPDNDRWEPNGAFTVPPLDSTASSG